MDGDAQRIAVFDRERKHLLAVAFRILGSDADAQDVVQEAWTRYARADTDGIDNVAAWLTTVVTRLCLDLLRRTREYPKEPARLPQAGVEPGGAPEDPEDVALLADELARALVIVLDELTPPQRVALILHDVFGTPFDEVAHVLGTTLGSAKKLASRARGRVRQHSGEPGAPMGAGPEETRRVVTAFLKAAQEGDLEGLVTLLHPEVTRTADPQALPPSTPQRVHGARQVALETRALQRVARRARVATIDGRAGIVVAARGDVLTALVFCVAEGRIAHYDVVADHRRLALLNIEDR
ncbi:sigma-70 family RNA polymerase sigma factor [Actinomadura sp. KC345]|uniref:sigma-70 family RNA polymerase sigma factor n=1 Tax=Actinomadura sp. KC345 TaxID=2530371 RepID=UPI001048C939|nr:sigma-70 family RNA polymerase sigma factor [Actinomadura sp. KC345]TDC50417.1 sigma-70 family RNA polymerase sigma factor [Actinomadura sp. KC345]